MDKAHKIVFGTLTIVLVLFFLFRKMEVIYAGCVLTVLISTFIKIREKSIPTNKKHSSYVRFFSYSIFNKYAFFDSLGSLTLSIIFYFGSDFGISSIFLSLAFFYFLQTSIIKNESEKNIRK